MNPVGSFGISGIGGGGMNADLLALARSSADARASEIQLRPLSGGVSQTGAVQESKDAFSTMLGRMVGEVSDRQAAAGQAVEGMLAGGNVSLHQAMIAMEEASVSFQLMVEVRNRLLESYQELMRMQV